jgi:hypothetical protein
MLALTHIYPLNEIVHKQEKTIENHEQKICKQFTQINTLERTVTEVQCTLRRGELVVCTNNGTRGHSIARLKLP